MPPTCNVRNQIVMFAIKLRPNESTGMSPFEILYGSNPRAIMDIYKHLVDKNLSEETKDVYSCTVELKERIIYLAIYAKQVLEQSGQKHRLYANQKSILKG